jgi:hypothetical protein
MRAIARYVKEYFVQLDKLALLLVMALLSVLIAFNYTIGIEDRIKQLPPLLRFLGFYCLFGFTFFTAYFIVFKRSKLPTPFDYFFYVLLLVSPAIFAAKMSFDPVPTWLADRLSYPSFSYWELALSWPLKAIGVFVCVWLLWRIGKYEGSVAGLARANFSSLPYIVLLLCMIPLIAAAATQTGFQETYPKLKHIAFIQSIVPRALPFQALYEVAYGTDFFTIELFFRGFIVLAFARYAGAAAILPMAAFYCTIHFGKPMAECISSFFGGLILGAVVYRTRSIWGGLIIHLGIAWLMELAGLLIHQF